jgi:hypothetical protein
MSLSVGSESLLVALFHTSLAIKQASKEKPLFNPTDFLITFVTAPSKWS